MDKLKKSSLIFKLNELQNRVSELNDKADGQLEVLNVLSRSIDKIVEELSNEENNREG